MAKRKNPAAVSLGRRGGKTKTRKKAAAARANGKKGGRPPTKRKRSTKGPRVPEPPPTDEREDDDLDEDTDPHQCPYCGSTDDCPHLLLFVDVDFGTGYGGPALGGWLYDAFNTAWGRFDSKFSDDPEFNPHDPFRDLLNEVDGVARFSRKFEDETFHGCWGYQAFYIEWPHEVKPAIRKFRAACVGWRERWPHGSAPAAARAPRRR